MSPWKIWWRHTRYWSLGGALLGLTALVLFTVYEPGTRDWVEHGDRAVAGIRVSLQTRRSASAGALDVRLMSSAPVSGQAGFARPLRPLLVDDVVEEMFVPPGSAAAGEFVLDTASGRFTWPVGRVLP